MKASDLIDLIKTLKDQLKIDGDYDKKLCKYLISASSNKDLFEATTLRKIKNLENRIKEYKEEFENENYEEIKGRTSNSLTEFQYFYCMMVSLLMIFNESERGDEADYVY